MEITIQLDVFERRFLLMLSERGGFVNMDSNNLSTEVLTALAALKQKGAIISIAKIGTSFFEYSLTSIGTNLIDAIKENNVH